MFPLGQVKRRPEREELGRPLLKIFRHDSLGRRLKYCSKRKSEKRSHSREQWIEELDCALVVRFESLFADRGEFESAQLVPLVGPMISRRQFLRLEFRKQQNEILNMQGVQI